MIGFIQRELNRINQLLTDLDPDCNECKQLMLIQETLCWTLDPNMFQSTVDIVLSQNNARSSI
jgi:hypothetical protein